MSHSQLSTLLQIEHHVRRSETLAELNFVIVNELRSLVPYDQCVLLSGNDIESLYASAVSDHPTVDRTSPFIAWVERIAAEESKTPDTAKLHLLSSSQWSSSDLSDLADFSPHQILWVPLLLPAKPNQRVGVLWLARSQPWNESETGLLQHLAGTFAHAIHSFEKQSVLKQFSRGFVNRKIARYSLLVLFLLMFVPVRLSVIAPAEVTAKDPTVIASQLNAAVKKITVQPGQIVKTGDILVQFDETNLKSAFDVAEQELLRTKAELHTAQQSGFADPRQNAKVKELDAQVALKEAERDFARKRLEQSVLYATHDGIVILKDPKEWEGKPVVIGERIMTLANPEKAELKIMLPVHDAISLPKNADITLFPDANPTLSVKAHLRYTSYEAELTPENIMAYKLIANFVTDDAPLQIGMRGSSKIYGNKVSLFYYLFRRPMTAVRQWLGW